MGKPKMIGTFKPYTPNNKAGRLNDKKAFFRGKDSAESYERLDKMRERKYRKDKWK